MNNGNELEFKKFSDRIEEKLNKKGFKIKNLRVRKEGIIAFCLSFILLTGMASAETKIVATNDRNSGLLIRKGMSTEASSVGKILYGSAVHSLWSNGDWDLISLDDDKDSFSDSNKLGFVSNRYLEECSVIGEGFFGEIPNYFGIQECHGYLQSNYLSDLKLYPDDSSKTIGKIPAGACAEIVGKNSNYYLVIYDGGNGQTVGFVSAVGMYIISDEQVRLIREKEDELKNIAQGVIYVTENDVRIRQDKNDSDYVIGKANRGMSFKFLSYEDGFYKIYVPGCPNPCYISARYVTTDKDGQYRNDIKYLAISNKNNVPVRMGTSEKEDVVAVINANEACEVLLEVDEDNYFVRLNANTLGFVSKDNLDVKKGINILVDKSMGTVTLYNNGTVVHESYFDSSMVPNDIHTYDVLYNDLFTYSDLLHDVRLWLGNEADKKLSKADGEILYRLIMIFLNQNNEVTVIHQK